MKWVKRNDLNSVQEIVLQNTGMSLEDLLCDTRVFVYPNLDKAAK